MYYCKYIIHMYLLLHYIKPFYFQTRYGESINNRKQKQIYFQFFMRNESEMKNLIKKSLIKSCRQKSKNSVIDTNQNSERLLSNNVCLNKCFIK